MIRRICLMSLGLLTLVSFNGCCEKEYIYIDRIKIEKVPVPCNIDVNCSWGGSDTEVIGGMLTCIVNMKEASNSCKSH